MVEGVNYYWISIEMKPEASLLTTFTVQMPMAEINNMPATIVWDGKSDVRRMGIGVRHAGDDGASAYRIPGLVTTGRFWACTISATTAVWTCRKWSI